MRFKVAHKLMLSFGALCVLTALLAIFQMSRFSEAVRIMTAMATYDLEVSEQIREIGNRQSELRSLRETAIAAAALAGTQGQVPDTGNLRQRHDEHARALIATVEAMEARLQDRSTQGVTERRRAYWTELLNITFEFDRALRASLQQDAALIDFVERGQLDRIEEQRDRLEQARRPMQDRRNQLHATVARLSDTGRQDVTEIYNEAVRSSVIALLVVVAAAVLIAYIIGRSITGRLGTAIGYVARVGQGDLTQTVTVPGDDELAALGRDLNDMTGKLRSMAQTTRATAESVHAATAQIRASTQQQAASVSQQLAAVEETTATLSEITESGAQISRRAQDVAKSAQTASATSGTGLKAVEDTNTAMDAIREQAEAVAENIVILSERTQAIGEIIVTVNDIAERCHLLALNAAIEAAAAGEHGRTFAIVAAEIKSLADQSKEATVQVRSNLSEIQHGINSSVMLTEEAVKRVTAGKRQTDAAQGTIRDMAENIQESVIAFQQIVAGTNQQQIGLEQVIQALQNIRAASSQTAAGTRQLEGAATNLNDLGQGLVEAVRNYRV
ncbi:methyl-accepting chemotaxis protein [Azospirillum sp. SYSU D00513]|uniref:methyl-accepting chemotaxis protein n=1 Tax=Azospirillum sp. SYSU D00513 TaxID=2812561 RepID=UPI001A961049|nr:methyl-accepting chemotaxis protein [Azospirillum sp. SYSU D00513]